MPSWLILVISIGSILIIGGILLLIGIMGENISRLRNINVELKGEIKHLQEKNNELEKQHKQLKEQNSELERELMKYDKKRKRDARKQSDN